MSDISDETLDLTIIRERISKACESDSEWDTIADALAASKTLLSRLEARERKISAPPPLPEKPRPAIALSVVTR